MDIVVGLFLIVLFMGMLGLIVDAVKKNNLDS